jgi:oligoendopeptidase F
MGKPRDVMTLAHELGHGVHQVLAGEQGMLMSHTPLTLAETASRVRRDAYLSFHAGAHDGSARAQGAAGRQKAEDMLNTVIRQIAFYTFERKVHERRKGELTSRSRSANCG